MNPERTILSGSISGISIASNITFGGFPNDLNMLLDLKGYPSFMDAFYISATEEIKTSDKGQWIEVDFNTMRNIRDIEIKWPNRESRAINFDIEYSINGINRELTRIENNTDEKFTLNLKSPMKMEKMRIIVRKAGQNRLKMKSLSIR